MTDRELLEAAERLEAQEGALLRARVGSAEAARQMVRVGL